MAKEKTFVMEVTKVIVVEVEATSESKAKKMIEHGDYEDDGAWERAEPTSVVLDVR